MYYTIILILILIIIISYLKSFKNKLELFDKQDIGSINSVFNKCGGFYSLLGFKLNHYIYAKKYGLDFSVSENDWSYTIVNGWTDYFEPVEIKHSKNNNKLNYKIDECYKILEDFTLQEYKDAIPELYRYNQKTLNIINNKKKELGIDNKEYCGIYIRRGDKLVDETIYVPSKNFVDILFEKNPNCKTIFVQTDDYNSVRDIKDYINMDDIEILTLCPENMFGSISNNDYYNKMKNNNVDTNNEDYMKQINENLSKPISDLNITERYLHTIELLTSIDILLHASTVICDFDSNISRFIKLAHDNIDNVYDVRDRYQNLDLSIKKCPSHSF
jgi:hypothetical protein